MRNKEKPASAGARTVNAEAQEFDPPHLQRRQLDQENLAAFFVGSEWVVAYQIIN